MPSENWKCLKITISRGVRWILVEYNFSGGNSLKITISRGGRWILLIKAIASIKSVSQNNYLTRGEMDSLN